MTDPLAAGLRQPDRRSCGAATVVMARMLKEPSYAERVGLPETFRAEVLAVHRRVTGSGTADGRRQLPWPRLVGTPPWAVARELTRIAGAGRPYSVETVRWDTGVHDRLTAATSTGAPAALYVGSAWLPRHVVLVVGSPLRCYEPSSGLVVALTRESFAAGWLRLAGWDRPWFVVDS